ncbi:MAG: hypothetical protein LBP43_02910 [Treponema sp.]|nr:hypothetical protein [Treponema sp.]
MKGGKTFLFILGAALYLTACAGAPSEKAEEVRAAPPEQPPKGGLLRIGPEKSPLREAPPENLPPEARSYLETLARAFRSGDRDFLLSQGEASFEAEVRPFYDEASYLALLYRIGPYGEDNSQADQNIPRLFPDEIDHIEYVDWEERGPLLEIRGRLIHRGGSPLPCLIMLVWKLPEPKIQGLFP